MGMQALEDRDQTRREQMHGERRRQTRDDGFTALPTGRPIPNSSRNPRTWLTVFIRSSTSDSRSMQYRKTPRRLHRRGNSHPSVEFVSKVFLAASFAAKRE